MKIAIEAQRIFRKNKHGMDFVALEVIRELQKADHINEYYILVSPGEDHCLEETSNFKIVELKMPSYPLWEQVALPLAIRRIRPDVLHCTSNTAPIFCPAPLVLTLHDIIFLEKQTTSNKSMYQRFGRYYRRLVVPRILSSCRSIITVSEFEKKHIRESLTTLPENKLVAVYNGFSDHFYHRIDCRAVLEKYDLPETFLFFLGNTDPKKNAIRVIRAYADYRKKSKSPLPLVIADMKVEVLLQIAAEAGVPEVTREVKLPGYLNNRDLPYIYSAASIFLYPSLRESFGIPILEAMACQTPIITANTSAMPEIAGAGATLVDPLNETEIADAIIRLEEDLSYRESQIQYGLERVRQFSWENTARSLLNIYRNLKK